MQDQNLLSCLSLPLPWGLGVVWKSCLLMSPFAGQLAPQNMGHLIPQHGPAWHLFATWFQLNIWTPLISLLPLMESFCLHPSCGMSGKGRYGDISHGTSFVEARLSPHLLGATVPDE